MRIIKRLSDDCEVEVIKWAGFYKSRKVQTEELLGGSRGGTVGGFYDFWRTLIICVWFE